MNAPRDGEETGDLLLVIGAARSGTSLTSKLLLQYFDFGMGPEGQWIIPLAKRARAYGDLEDDENLGRLIRAILSTDMFDIVHEQYSERFGWPVRVTEEKVRRALRSRTYGGVAWAALYALARELRRTRVGSKDPSFAWDLERLETTFGGRAKYLCLIRDGRDVALSMMKRPWGQKSWYANARVWADTYERIEVFRARLPSDRFLAIRYEDLLRTPEAICRQLESFLESPLDPERRSEFVLEIAGGVRRHNYEKWIPHMSERDHRLYESVSGPWLERYGYRRVQSGASARLWERAWYMGREYARRARRWSLRVLGLLPPDTSPTPTDPDAPGT